MFSEFEFGAGLFGDGAGVPVPPTPTPATFQRLKVECKTLTCTGVPDTSLYSIQDPIPSRIVAAAECKTNDCTGIAADSQSYSLQDALYFNGTALTVPVTCPPGATCIPGSFPPTVTYPPGRFVFPDVPLNPGEPINLCLDGCQSTVCRLLPAGSSQAVINAAANAIILEVATQQAQCDTFPDFPFGTTVELTDLLDYACLGGSFSDSVLAVVTPASYPATFSIIGGSLPDGITMAQNGTTASFTGTPTTAGSSTFTLRATSANGVSATRAYTIEVVGITNASPLPDAVIGEPYSETLAVVGITGSVIWGIAAGSLPAGLVFDTTTGEISGTPTASGAVAFSVFVQNETRQCIKTFGLDVTECLITTASPLPNATDGVAYSTTLAATDITGTLTWSIIAGSLPNGLSLNTATGEISGTPTTVQTANFTAQVENGTGNICSKDFQLEVEAAASIPKAWWTMDAGTPNAEVDAVSGLVLAQIFGSALSFTSVSGVVSNALQLSVTPAASAGSRCVNAALAFNGVGSTFVAWVNISDFLPGIDNSTLLFYNFDQGGVSYAMIIQNPGGGGNWTASYTINTILQASVNLGSAAGWHFLSLSLNAATGEIIFDIDRASSGSAFGPAIPPGAPGVAFVLIANGAGPNPAATQTSIFDEFALFDGVLSSADLDFLYNGGAGRTYPY